MTLMLDGAMTQRVPLETDQHGVVRVGGTRVPLDTIVAAHQQGQSPEDIVAGYDSLHLADVYAVIAYYLSRRAEVDAYLTERERAAERLRAMIEANPRSRRFRAHLQTLKAQQAEHGAPPRG